ncbi:MAG: sulfur carrier protein ThiS [Pontibacterium sp.]
MQIHVNGEPKEIADQATLLDLIESLGLAGRRIAVELNMDIVPRSEHPAVQLKEGDELEIVHAIGGG